MAEVVIIGGCGHVGLPLGLAFADAGVSTTALDIDQAKVDTTNAGKMPFDDRGADEVLKRVLAKKTFSCSTDPSVITKAEIVITVIGTPVDEHLNPRFDVMRDFVLKHRAYFRPGQLLIMRSTLYPGTTARVQQLLVNEKIPIELAFCPERVAEGVALEEIRSLPQIISGCTPVATERAASLFKKLTKDVIILEPAAAELTKLFNNAWRYIQFAAANQFYMIATDFGVDFYDVHRAMTENYPRGKSFPKAGFAAGPCLFKDTMQIAASFNNNFFLGHSAMLVNEGLPNYIVQRVLRQHDLSTMTVGILGMTFKADSDDTRDSLSFKLRALLQAEAKEVLCTDPYITRPWLTSLEETLSRSDVLFIGVPHTPYRKLEFTKPVVDVWNMTASHMSI